MIERRYCTGEVRVGGQAGRVVIEGYAAVFETVSENLGGFVERIAPGAFDDVLGDDVRGLFNHDANLILGRTTAGTLRIAADSKGLMYEITPPETQYARDLLAVMERGDVTQSSFAFTVRDDEWAERGEGPAERRVLKLERLYDVSPVTFPAYGAAGSGIGVRSLETLVAAWERELAARGDVGALDNFIGRLTAVRNELHEASAQVGGGVVERKRRMLEAQRMAMRRNRLALASLENKMWLV